MTGLTDATRLAVVGEGATYARRATGRVVSWGTNDKGRTDPMPVDVGTSDKMFGCLGDRCRHREWSGSHQRSSWTCTKAAAHVTCKVRFVGRHDEGTSTDDETGFGNLDTARDIRMPSNETGLMCVADTTGAVSCFLAVDGAERGSVVEEVTDAIQLAPFGEETCALERAGTVKCWNERERANIGGKVRTMARVTDGVELVGDSLHACVRHKAGTVSCWGMRSILGDNVDVHQTTPLVVPGVTL